MAMKITGKNLIAGNWVSGQEKFQSDPASGPKMQFAVGSQDDVNAAAASAEDAFWSYGYLSRERRAAFLNCIANEIEARGAAITKIGCQETGLPEARLEGDDRR